MPAFVAINVEPEDNLEDEVEVTRRIQIDDALKLYQTALKLHADGPKSYAEADKAYDALFKAAIFSYPEAATDYERSARPSDPPLTPGPSFAASLDLGVLDDNSAGSSLPEAYYIAYKNHGQFVLDKVRHKARVRRAEGGAEAGSIFDEVGVQDDSRKVLDDFGDALDRDPSDAELWRRTSRVAAFLNSARIERYCLEAAIELDDDPAVVLADPPSLAEGFSGEQLRNQLRGLADDMSLSHPIMAPYLRSEIAASLKRYLDPLPWLPNPTKNKGVSKKSKSQDANGSNASRITITFENPSWADLGIALVESVNEHGISGRALHLDAPDMPDENLIMQIEIDQQLSSLQQEADDHDSAQRSAPDQDGKDDGKEAGDAPSRQGDADADAADENAADENAAADGKDAAEKASQKDVQKERSASQSRKRSQSVAGLADAEEEHADTKRSKRIRRRETRAEEAADPNAVFAEQLQPFQEVDQALFHLTRQLLQKLGVEDMPTLDETIEICGQTEDRLGRLQNQPAKELRSALITSFKDDRARILLSKKDTPVLGLEAFLEHARSGHQHVPERAGLDELRGLQAFVATVNDGWYTIQDAVYEWLAFMSQSYGSLKWSEAMKRAVVQVLNTFDELLFRRVCHEMECWQSRTKPAAAVDELHHLVQMVFELYLDVYERITNPSSAVDTTARTETKLRLDRWMSLASDLARSSLLSDASLTFRFMWTSVFFTTITPGVPRDHILACWESLRQSLYDEEESGNMIEVVLPNNAVMPDVSYKAADREISKLTTMDFFLSLFQEELDDPVLVIDKLEPVLNPDSVYVPIGGESTGEEKPISECAAPELRDIWKFLRGSSTELRLFLWTRLADAYKEIDYSTKVLSCYLRSIEMIMDDLEGEQHRLTPQESKRLRTFMVALKTVDEMVIQALHIAVNDTHAFDIVDEAHIRASASALARISCMLHVAALHEDEVRIGMATTASNSQTFHGLQNKLREMQVRVWSLQYTVLKTGLNMAISALPAAEARLSAAPSVPGSTPKLSSPAPVTPTAQNSPSSPDAPVVSQLPLIQHELADFLDAIHHVVGSRKYCKVSNKIFLRLARAELLKMKSIENWEDYLGQVLYDLHGIKLGVGLSEVQDHGCPIERLERKNALALVDKVMARASGMQMKDLLKSDLKNTIEHMQQAIGQTKSTTQMIHNLRYFTEYLKRPIHPMRLYQAWRGTVELDTVPATTPDTVLARNGWFFLLGMIALTKFKGVDLNRRQTPGATDDLRVGTQYLRLQLQLTPSRWDAWFRLAECSDYDLDESVLWSAEKMNKDRGELVKLQRSAIHGYTLALSYFRADPDELPESSFDAVHDLYHNFGLRLYSSSREPFAMECFHHAEHERWFIATDTLTTYKKLQHGEMSDYMVWKYAAGLFRRALAQRAKDWKSAYLLSKCIWKMYQKPLEELDPRERASHPTVDDVVSVLEKSIAVVSLLPKPRHGQDPVLEPHYKIVSTVDKLVRRGKLHAQAAADILQRQPYAIQRGAAVSVTNPAEWDEFIVKSLQYLHDKDKSNWQHRIVIRQARILFGDCDLKSNNGQAPEATEVAKEPATNGVAGPGPNGASATNGCEDTAEHAKAEPAAAADGPKSVDKNSNREATVAGNGESSKSSAAEATNGEVVSIERPVDIKMEDGADVDEPADTIVVKPIPEKSEAAPEKMDVDPPVVKDDDATETASKTPEPGSDAVDAAAEKPAGKPEKPEKPEKPTEKQANATDKPTDTKEPTVDAAELARQEKAKAAFAVLRESMFTKTMVMNVWKCDAERPGRHHVFTEQYIRFMTRLLVVMDDRINLEALLRRIRKKGADFYHFNDLWQTCIISYLRLLRKHYKITHAADDAFKNVTAEEFEIYAERIAEWVGEPEVDHHALSAMREAIEIKKLNGNLMKAGPIDDLISDCYGAIFADIGRRLPGEDPSKIIEERNRVQREEAEKAEKAERAERAEKEKKAEAASSTTAAIMLSFNLLSDITGGADKDSINGFSRAGSEAPGGAGSLLAAEKMERQGSGVGGSGDHPQRRTRVLGVRRPDILRKAEQATARLGDLASRTASGDLHSAGSTATALQQGRRGATGGGDGTGVGSMSRRSTRLGSSSSARQDLSLAGMSALSRGDGGAISSGKDGEASGAEAEGGDGSNSRAEGMLARRRSTRSKSRHRSVEQDRGEDEEPDDTEMKDAGDNEEGEEGEEGDGNEDDGEGEEGTGRKTTGGAKGKKKSGADASASPQGSMNDWADDESELSDVPPDYEENAPSSMLFPSLHGGDDAPVAAGDETDSAKSDDSSDEDGDDEAGDDEAEDDDETEDEGGDEVVEAEEEAGEGADEEDSKGAGGDEAESDSDATEDEGDAEAEAEDVDMADETEEALSSPAAAAA